MSGSGGGGYVPPQKTKFDCDNGRIKTNVSSIDLMVLAKHKIEDVLELEVNESSLVLVDADGETLGAVLHLNTVDIIECIEKGHRYEGRIIHINTPQCTVNIKRK